MYDNPDIMSQTFPLHLGISTSTRNHARRGSDIRRTLRYGGIQKLRQIIPEKMRNKFLILNFLF